MSRKLPNSNSKLLRISANEYYKPSEKTFARIGVYLDQYEQSRDVGVSDYMGAMCWIRSHHNEKQDQRLDAAISIRDRVENRKGCEVLSKMVSDAVDAHRGSAKTTAHGAINKLAELKTLDSEHMFAPGWMYLLVFSRADWKKMPPQCNFKQRHKANRSQAQRCPRCNIYATYRFKRAVSKVVSRKIRQWSDEMLQKRTSQKNTLLLTRRKELIYKYAEQQGSLFLNGDGLFDQSVYQEVQVGDKNIPGGCKREPFTKGSFFTDLTGLKEMEKGVDYYKQPVDLKRSLFTAEYWKQIPLLYTFGCSDKSRLDLEHRKFEDTGPVNGSHWRLQYLNNRFVKAVYAQKARLGRMGKGETELEAFLIDYIRKKTGTKQRRISRLRQAEQDRYKVRFHLEFRQDLHSDLLHLVARARHGREDAEAWVKELTKGVTRSGFEDDPLNFKQVAYTVYKGVPTQLTRSEKLQLRHFYKQVVEDLDEYTKLGKIKLLGMTCYMDATLGVSCTDGSRTYRSMTDPASEAAHALLDLASEPPATPRVSPRQPHLQRKPRSSGAQPSSVQNTDAVSKSSGQYARRAAEMSKSRDRRVVSPRSLIQNKNARPGLLTKSRSRTATPKWPLTPDRYSSSVRALYEDSSSYSEGSSSDSESDNV